MRRAVAAAGTAWMAVAVCFVVSQTPPVAPPPTGGPTTAPATRPTTTKPTSRPITHDRRSIEGWTVHVHREFQARHPALCAAVVKETSVQLRRIVGVIPDDKARLLQAVPIWIEPGGRGVRPTTAFYGGRAGEKADAVEIGEPEAFLAESRHDQPWVLLRELSYALDYKLFKYNNAEVKAAFAKAVGGPLEKVVQADGRTVRHHGLVGAKDFFVEFSVAYFGHNDIWPFTRAELVQNFPDIAQVIRNAWYRPSPCIPTARYDRRRIEGWTVLVNPDFAEYHPAECADVLAEVEAQLYRIRQAVPADKLRILQETRLWIERESVHESAAVFHPYPQWLTANNLNADKLDGIELCNAGKFLALARDGAPWILFHELSHAYDWKLYRYENPAILAGWKAFVARGDKGGRLKDVLHFNGAVEPHNARSSATEFFAEFSATWFGRNEMYPFVRAELEKEDPDTAALIREVWFSPAPRPATRPAAGK
ncbi:MAG: hypothetical protein NTV86_07245 [Planctomycetota bacterium]|nr:hypothetical protein [Planctomycetota bacterium]